MAYEVLARKWRPQRFEEVVGQEHVTTTLANAVRQGRVAHGYIFSGMRGVGKTTTARILAKALNCAEGPTPTPCGKCPACEEIARGVSLDCLEIDGASNRGIEEIRTLRERVNFAPVGGKSKVYIIDEVHMLTTEAFNALLKTLEEPPPHVVFVFATTNLRKVLPTIQSRCQSFQFRRIPAAKIEEHLGRVAAGEGLEVEPAALALVARRADGSLRDAESLLEQVSTLRGSGRLTAEECRAFLGVMADDCFFAAGQALFAGDGQRLLTLLEELVRDGGEPVEFAEGLTQHLRNLLVVSLDPNSAALSDLSGEEIRRLREESRRLGEVDLLGTLERVSAVLPQVRRSPQPRLELEVALLGMAARAGSGASVGPVAAPGASSGGEGGASGRVASDVAARPPAASQPPAQAPPRSTPAAPAAKDEGPSASPAPAREEERPVSPADSGEEQRVARPAASGERQRAAAHAARPASAPGDGLTLAAVEQVWEAFVAEVAKRRRSLAAFLQPATVAGVEGGRVILCFPAAERFSMSQVENRQNHSYLTGILRELVGSEVTFACRAVEGDKVAEGDRAAEGVEAAAAPAGAATPESGEASADEERLLRRVLDAFDGEIVEGEGPPA